MVVFLLAVLLLGACTLSKADVIAIDSQNCSDVFLDSELRFMKEMVGVIVEADPPDACTNITSRPATLNSSINCFVLIQGSSCSLEDKVIHASRGNYSAAIIYDVGMKGSYVWENRITLLRIFSYYNITAILISTESAVRLIENYLYNIDPGSRILITMNHLNMISVLLLFAIVGGIFLFLMLLFMMLKCLRGARQRRRCRLPTRYLKHIPTSRYKSGDPYETCAICLENYKEKEKLRILPCSHAYHSKCVDPWLTDNRRTCPVCKQKIRITGIHDNEDSDSDTNGRAESAPLIRGAARPINHGTFSTRVQIAIHSSSNASGETTSRDAPSDALDDIPETFKPIASSAPEVMMARHFSMASTSTSYHNAMATALDHENGADNISQSSVSSGSPILKNEKTYVV